MTRRLALLATAVAVLGALLVPAASARERFHTDPLALVPEPGFPAHAHVHPNGRIYVGTYDDPSGSDLPSRVFEYAMHMGDATLRRSWTLTGQDLSGPHGVQAATSDARGRIVLLDKSPPRVRLLNTVTGNLTTYASFPAGSIPNYAAWGPDGALYVTDYAQPILWRIRAGGGTPKPWLTDARLDGDQFGTTGLVLAGDRQTLLVAQQSSAGGGGGNPTTGRIYRVPIDDDGSPGDMTQLWESQPFDGPDGFAVAQSGTIYIALLATNQIAVISGAGDEIERFPPVPATGDNGSSIPFDSPSSARFRGTSLIVAQQSFFAGDPNHQAILDVETNEPGLPELIPRNAGLKDAKPPTVKRVSITPEELRFRITEDADVHFLVERHRGDKWRFVRESSRDLELGNHVLSMRELARKPDGLRPAKWRVTITATDVAGNESEPVKASVRVRE